ncbi:hypothetical protein [Xanthobacter flavus]|uniref:hypothetical protein n=1 Tax=Xanthobacter flavus TaxID=281 RepID=UPI00372AE1B5
MAYNRDSLVTVSFEPLGGDFKMWRYSSTDATATVAGAGYIADALKMGMKVGDVVFVSKTDTNAITIHRVTAVSGAGATLSAGLAIT